MELRVVTIGWIILTPFFSSNIKLGNKVLILEREKVASPKPKLMHDLNLSQMLIFGGGWGTTTFSNL